jgi:hypothetical protein
MTSQSCAERPGGAAIAILRRLDDLAVKAHGAVVDKDASVNAGQIDATFGAVVEGVKGADDIVSVDAHVQGEVVACSRRHANVRHVVCGGYGRHSGLRAVAAGHADGICT